MPTSLAPPPRWVPIDVWLLAFQEHQRTAYGAGAESVAQVLAAMSAPPPPAPRKLARRVRLAELVAGDAR